MAKLSAGTLARLDVLLVNEHEAAWLTGPGADFRQLLDLGPRAAVVTLGAAGAVVVEAGSTTEVASPKVEAVDSTGAGDAFSRRARGVPRRRRRPGLGGEARGARGGVQRDPARRAAVLPDGR